MGELADAQRSLQSESARRNAVSLVAAEIVGSEALQESAIGRLPADDIAGKRRLSDTDNRSLVGLNAHGVVGQSRVANHQRSRDRSGAIIVVVGDRIGQRDIDRARAAQSIDKDADTVRRQPVADGDHAAERAVDAARSGRRDQEAIATVAGKHGVGHYERTRSYARTEANSGIGEIADRGLLDIQGAARVELDSIRPGIAAVDIEPPEIDDVASTGIDGDADTTS